MKTVQIRQVVLGEGTPKICVPIVAKTLEEITEQTRGLLGLTFDLIEWRADWYEALQAEEGILKGMKAIRDVFPEVPILFTIRTEKEGGEITLSDNEYLSCCKGALEAGADLVDGELFMGDSVIRELTCAAHALGRFVVGSSHDFNRTPAAEELADRLGRMEALGCDIGKIAVMPESRQDVLRLLSVTEQMSRTLTIPIITMSMSGTGVLSRLCGEVFGSCLTFGAAKKASAPGQIGTEELAAVLNIIHKSL